jgi:hypothetical protein
MPRSRWRQGSDADHRGVAGAAGAADAAAAAADGARSIPTTLDDDFRAATLRPLNSA